jgi:SP family myo-inositol transporter-like MFS transporter 13
MIIGLVACSIAFSYLDLDMISTTTPGASASSSLWPSILIFSLIIYVSAYAIGLGSVPWQQGELFALSVRSVGSGVATSTNWAANTIVGVTFLPMMEALSPSVTFAVYAAVCVGAWWGVWKIFPELAGLSLEEVGEVLKGGWGVHRTMTLVQHDRDGDEGISSSD